MWCRTQQRLPLLVGARRTKCITWTYVSFTPIIKSAPWPSKELETKNRWYSLWVESPQSPRRHCQLGTREKIGTKGRWPCLTSSCCVGHPDLNEDFHSGKKKKKCKKLLNSTSWQHLAFIRNEHIRLQSHWSKSRTATSEGPRNTRGLWVNRPCDILGTCSRCTPHLAPWKLG